MRRLLTSYAVSFNHRNKRSGHLFQNRYKSIVSEGIKEGRLDELVGGGSSKGIGTRTGFGAKTEQKKVAGVGTRDNLLSCNL